MSSNKNKHKPDDKEQFARFIKTAKQIEQKDNPQEAFEEAIRKIAKKKRLLKAKLPLSSAPDDP